MRIKLIIDADIISTQPLTMGVIESISEVGELKVKDISKCSGLDKREARKSSQPGQCKSKAHALPAVLSPLSERTRKSLATQLHPTQASLLQ